MQPSTTVLAHLVEGKPRNISVNNLKIGPLAGSRYHLKFFYF